MNHPHDPYTSRRIELAAGESLQFRTRAGTHLIVGNGSLLLTHPPIWLGEQMLRARVPLEAGQTEQIEDGGWVGLTGGRQGGEVHVVAAARPRVLAALLAAWRRLRRSTAAPAC